MKRLMIALAMGFVIVSCSNGAHDQDPKTDTTTMPVDPNLSTDTSNHINRADGTRPLDTSGRDTLR